MTQLLQSPEIKLFLDAFAEAIAQKTAEQIRATYKVGFDQPDALIPAAEIRQRLGKNGRPMAPQTFQRQFIETGILQYVENPNDMRSRYVSAKSWQKAAQDLPLRVISLTAA